MSRLARLPSLLLGVLLLAAGAVFGWFAKPSPPAEVVGPEIYASRTPEPNTAAPSPAALAAARPVVADPLAPPSAPAAVAGPDDEIRSRIRERLGGEAPDAVVAAARVRRDALLHSAAASAANEAANDEVNRREIARFADLGELPKILELIQSDAKAADELVADGKRLRSLLAPRVAGPRVARNDLKDIGAADVAEGTTFLLPEGKFAFPPLQALASGVTISGLGIDRTFVDGELSPRDGGFASVTFEDLTLTGQHVVDSRRLLLLTMRRVRAAGYNSGAGGSSFLDVRSGDIAVLCEDCVFDGVVGSRGRAKGPDRHGTPFSLSARGMLLRFERCTFVGNREIVRRGASAVHFDRCTFRGNRRARVEGAVYVGCTFDDNGDDPK